MVAIYSALCAFLPCIAYLIIKNRKEKKFSLIFILLFILYIWMVYNVTGVGGLTDIFYAPEGGSNSIIRANINLNPFSNGIGITFYLNIIMCIPLGFLLPFIWKDYRKLYKTLLLGAGFSLLIEISQLITTRATDVDDLIANTIGTFVGYIIWLIFTKIFNKHFKGGLNGSKGPIIYIALSFLGMFFLYFPFWFALNIEPILLN